MDSKADPGCQFLDAGAFGEDVGTCSIQRMPQQRPGCSAARTTTRIAISSAVSYWLVYFTRYPIFMLPENLAHQHFARFFGVDTTLQEALVLAFSLGFGIAKFPAVPVMTSSFVFRHRFATIVLLIVSAICFTGLPLAFSDGQPQLSAMGLFLGCFPQSWIYGGMVTYLEGRRSTEMLMAVMTFFSVSGGSASRGFAEAVLNFGMNPVWMPFLIAVCVLPPVMFLFFILDRSPLPDAMDIAQRRKRTAMTSKERQLFVLSWWPGLTLIIFAYMMITALRQFRDLFCHDLLTAANGGITPSPLIVACLDLPGALTAFVTIAACGRFGNNVQAFVAMIILMIMLLLSICASTLAYSLKLISGVSWQYCVSIGLYGTYAILSGSPLYDRLLAAASPTGGTSAFLIFASDCIGYAATIVLLLWKTFGQKGPSADILAQFIGVAHLLSIASVACFLLALVYFKRRLRGN